MTDRTPKVQTIDRNKRWEFILGLAKTIAYRDDAPNETESALCGAVVRAREFAEQIVSLERELAALKNAAPQEVEPPSGGSLVGHDERQTPAGAAPFSEKSAIGYWPPEKTARIALENAASQVETCAPPVISKNHPRKGAPMSVKPIFAWYDLWIGVFIDAPKSRIYIFPIPCAGIVIQWKRGRP